MTARQKREVRRGVEEDDRRREEEDGNKISRKVDGSERRQRMIRTERWDERRQREHMIRKQVKEDG